MNNGTKIKTFTDLSAWKKSHEIALSVYEFTKRFPDEEKFSLVSQMRRSAVSISSNIAEGFSRNSYQEKAYFYSISRGSTTELQSQLIIAKDLGYVRDKDFDNIFPQSIVVHKLINGLVKGCRTRSKPNIAHNS